MPQLEATTRPEDVGLSSGRLARIRPWMEAYVDAGKLPWAMTLVARHGEIALVRGDWFGRCRVRHTDRDR